MMQGKIISSRRTGFDELKLTWIQKLVCSIFKITPLIKARHSFIVEFDSDIVCNGDIVGTQDGNTYMVVINTINIDPLGAFKTRTITLMSNYFTEEIKSVKGDFYILSRGYYEFSDSNQL